MNIFSSKRSARVAFPLSPVAAGCAVFLSVLYILQSPVYTSEPQHTVVLARVLPNEARGRPPKYQALINTVL